MTDEFPDRLRVAVSNAGGVAELGRKSGVAARTISGYLAGKGDPARERLVALADAGGVSVEWLASGRGSEAGMAEGGTSYSAGAAGLPGDYTLVPHLDVEVATGGGALVEDEEELNRLAFVRRYLKKRGVRPDSARLVTARGDSMEPTISDGDTILVDTSVQELRDDSIYCIQVGGTLRAKRLQRDMRGGVWVISDNPQYEDEHLEAREAAELQIVGRVVWIGRDV